MTPTLLMFNIPEKKRGLLRILSLRYGFKLQNVVCEQNAIPLSDILNGKPGEEPSAPIDEEMLVLCNISSSGLNGILSELRHHHSGIALKAVLTDTNKDWTPLALYRELCAERKTLEDDRTRHP